MRALGRWVLPVLALAGVAAAPGDAPVQSALVPPGPRPSGDGKGTHCGNCHSVAGWTSVVFPHDRTGFPLKGAHAVVSCKACHPVDFVVKVPEVCSGCHRDAHQGSLGARCEGCHDETSWRSSFTIDAHRFTNFPLTGRHAVLPCESCHPDARNRTFSRQTVGCDACHQGDFLRAGSQNGVDHLALGFSTDCQQCHDVRRFAGARFSQHDSCFQLSVGPHAGLRCNTCHSAIVATGGACTSNTETCTSCHAHAQGITDAQHTNTDKGPGVVPGYQYQSGRCYFCHKFSG